ncbi:MAG: hypothetical protein ACK4HF_18150 [Paracoccaceae bacterium]
MWSIAITKSPPALKLFLGRSDGIETRRIETMFNAEHAEQTFALLARAFHMPVIRNRRRIFRSGFEISDAVLSTGFVEH